MSPKVGITNKNNDLARLEQKWGRPEFSSDDGIGPLDSLHQASDAIVAIAGFFEDKLQIIGSGIMIAPGIAFTATHVLEEFPRSGQGPVLLTFLPDGYARTWLPTATVTCSAEWNRNGANRNGVKSLSLIGQEFCVNGFHFLIFSICRHSVAAQN